jgi:hypothetical protein
MVLAVALGAQACASAPAPTPQIIYVTPEPAASATAADEPRETTPPATPTVAPAAAPTEAVPQATPAPTPDPDAWIPKGFKDTTLIASYLDWPVVAYRFLKRNEFKCRGFSRCSGMIVIPRDGCPSNLYVELSVVNRNDAVIDYTNDSVGRVDAGQRARLIFDGIANNAKGVKLSEFSCY